MREYQAKHRGSKRSYVNEIEDLAEQVRRLQICLAWEAAEISEGTAAKLLGVERVQARVELQEAIARGVGYDSWDELMQQRSTQSAAASPVAA